MGASSQPGTATLVDIIRRTLRVLGAQPARAMDPETIIPAARLVYERLRRAGVPTLWIESEPGAPLIVAGHGPVAVSTYLDDSHPDTAIRGSSLPEFDDGTVRATGIERTAAVVAAIAPMLVQPELGREFTLIVETDRHNGSRALERWLATGDRVFSSAAWEIADLPITPPVVALSASGSLQVEVKLSSTRRRAEQVYGTVLPDPGFALANFLAALKTADEEVRLDGFYDGIASPEDAQFDSLLAVVAEVNNWLRHIARDERNLSTSHMTLGLFCAPAITVRELSLHSAGPYLPEQASAQIEFQLLPGQSINQILTALADGLEDTPFGVEITPHLARPPVEQDPALELPASIHTIPIAPGPSPAALFAERHVPGLGYAVVGRTVSRDRTGIELRAIREGSGFILSLVEALSSQRTSVHR